MEGPEIALEHFDDRPTAEQRYLRGEPIMVPIILDYRNELWPSRPSFSHSLCEACACILEWHSARKGVRESLDPRFLYDLRVDRKGSLMRVTEALKLLACFGLPPRHLYHPTDPRDGIPDEVFDVASYNRITDYARVVSISGLKVSLSYNGPALIIVPVYTLDRASMWQPPDGAVGTPLGYRALVVVGYDSAGLIVRGGTDGWELEGCACLRYQEWNRVCSAWTLIGRPSPRWERWPPRKKWCVLI